MPTVTFLAQAMNRVTSYGATITGMHDAPLRGPGSRSDIGIPFDGALKDTIGTVAYRLVRAYAGTPPDQEISVTVEAKGLGAEQKKTLPKRTQKAIPSAYARWVAKWNAKHPQAEGAKAPPPCPNFTWPQITSQTTTPETTTEA